MVGKRVGELKNTVRQCNSSKIEELMGLPRAIKRGANESKCGAWVTRKPNETGSG